MTRLEAFAESLTREMLEAFEAKTNEAYARAETTLAESEAEGAAAARLISERRVREFAIRVSRYTFSDKETGLWLDTELPLDEPAPKPCPFWSDGEHCWKDGSSHGVRSGDIFERFGTRPGTPPTKTCACGAKVTSGR